MHVLSIFYLCTGFMTAPYDQAERAGDGRYQIIIGNGLGVLNAFQALLCTMRLMGSSEDNRMISKSLIIGRLTVFCNVTT